MPIFVFKNITKDIKEAIIKIDGKKYDFQNTKAIDNVTLGVDQVLTPFKEFFLTQTHSVSPFPTFVGCSNVQKRKEPGKLYL